VPVFPCKSPGHSLAADSGINRNPISCGCHRHLAQPTGTLPTDFGVRNPAIDNHTHPLLNEAHRDDFPFEELLSEAIGDALTEDAIHTLSCYRATKQLAGLYGCENDWDAVKAKRKELSYKQLCDTCMRATGIQCLLIDDGLDANGICEDIGWHDQFTPAPSKRIVRIEIVAQVRFSEVLVICVFLDYT